MFPSKCCYLSLARKADAILATGASQLFGNEPANLHGTKVKYKNKQNITVNKIYPLCGNIKLYTMET